MKFCGRRIISLIDIGRRRRHRVTEVSTRYVMLDRRVVYGHRLRFAIIVDGVIDAHLSRYVPDNRRTT